MTHVAILPIATERGDLWFHAVAGQTRAEGKTAGAALDAITAQLPADETSTLVVVQSLRPDAYFTEAQQHRLGELMTRWRAARDQGRSLPNAELDELQALVDAELLATAARAAALAEALGR